jgi:DNA-binding NtrC family response regulator
VVMSDSEQLGINDFPQAGTMQADSPNPLMEPVTIDTPISHLAEMITGAEIPIAPASAPSQLPSAYGTLAMVGEDGEVRPLEDMEAETIRFAISHYRGQMSEVARRLKIGRSTLYRKLDEAATSDADPSGQNR